MGGDASVKRTVHRPLLTKNAFVGAGALDGPFETGSNSPRMKKTRIFRRGDVGAAPYVSYFGFFDSMREGGRTLPYVCFL